VLAFVLLAEIVVVVDHHEDLALGGIVG